MRVYPAAGGFVVRWNPVPLVIFLFRGRRDGVPEAVFDVTGRASFFDEYRVWPFFEEVWYWISDEKGTVLEKARAVPQDRLVLLAIERIEEMAKVQGIPVALLFAKVGGKTCPRCYDKTLKKPTDPFCPVCLGTGFEGGYVGPVKTYAVKQSSFVRGKKNVDPIVQTFDSATFSLSSKFPLSPKDLVVDLQSGGIYKVVAVEERLEKGIPVSQTCQATLLERQNPAYKAFKIEGAPEGVKVARI